ncbi:hypothetical protein [Clostridium cochlearium]|uniref:Uncharacterized protein n=1 Tax=Clostridium cochlearium TaxID=1494 RepID=A0A7Y3V6D5_CLOCO|nr:hypothetical protein [Clostridium cochlearium]NOH15271.1 hypothetical protein [Clostridium cochlearium]
MNLKEFYFQNIEKSEYHYRFYDLIKNNNSVDNYFNIFGEVEDYGLEVHDEEDAIIELKKLCQPELDFGVDKNKILFYLITYYLHKSGYEIEEFPRVLARPPVNPNDFTYGEIRKRINEQGYDDNGTVRWQDRRTFVENFNCNIR